MLGEKADRLENMSVANELRITGIPSTQNENLLDVFNNICNIIEVPIPNLRTIFRVKNKNNATVDGPIFVKLSLPYERNIITRSLSLFRRNKGTFLQLHHIGTDSSTPIFINENLTHTNSSLMRAATKFKKDKKVAAAYSYRGRIYVKTDLQSTPILISSLGMLEDLLQTYFRETSGRGD